jgi:hypothetical protein
MILLYISLLCGAIVNAASSLSFIDDSWSGIVTGVPFQLTWKGNTGAVNITLNNGTTTNPNVVNPIASKTPHPNFTADAQQDWPNPAHILSNSYSWTPGVFAVPGKKFFIGLTDSTGANAYGDVFVVAATASSTTASASPSSTVKPKSTSSKTSATASSTQPPSSTSPPAGSDQDKGKLSTGAKVGIGIGCAVAFLVAGGLSIGFAVRRIHASRKKRSAEINGDGVEGTDGASDARLAEKSGFFGFRGKKGGEKGYTGVDQVHELQASERPGVQELDGAMRHELQ